MQRAGVLGGMIENLGWKGIRTLCGIAFIPGKRRYVV